MKFTKVAATKIRNTVNLINFERWSSSGQDRYINQATKVVTTVSANPENGGCKNSPNNINAAISAGTTNFGNVWIRSNSGALILVIILRKSECVTTGTVGFGFLGSLFLLTH